jgi:hypothetical protein
MPRPHLLAAWKSAKKLNEAEILALRKPNAMFSTSADFWGKQEPPAVIKTGVKTLDKLLVPGMETVRGMINMHNAIWQLTQNVKSFCAASHGGNEIIGNLLVGGLPSFSIGKQGPDGTPVRIATLDCEKQVTVHDEAAFNALDSDVTQNIACTKIAESAGKWLEFLRAALDGKGDMEVEVVDPTAPCPQLKVKENGYLMHAPWVTTRVRYGGFFGFCRTERDLTLEELLARKAARTRKGRRGVIRAARAQRRDLNKAFKTAKKDVAKKKKELGKMSPGEEKMNATVELATAEKALAEQKLANKAEIKRIRPLLRRGHWPGYRKALSGLRFIDPKPDSKSRLSYLESVGQGAAKTKGWTSGSRVPTLSAFVIEKRLLRRMKAEQKKRDKVIKGYLTLIMASVAQLNLLMPKLHKTIIETTGYKFSSEPSSPHLHEQPTPPGTHAPPPPWCRGALTPPPPHPPRSRSAPNTRCLLLLPDRVSQSNTPC